MDVPDSMNTILFATKQPGSWENFYENYNLLLGSDIQDLLLEAMAVTIMFQQPEPEATRVFTDDLAPIEWVTNKIVIDFFLEGNWEDLRWNIKRT